MLSDSIEELHTYICTLYGILISSHWQDTRTSANGITSLHPKLGLLLLLGQGSRASHTVFSLLFSA